MHVITSYGRGEHSVSSSRGARLRRTKGEIRRFLRAAEVMAHGHIADGYGPPTVRRIYYLLRSAAIGGVAEGDERFVKDALTRARKRWLAGEVGGEDSFDPTLVSDDAREFVSPRFDESPQSWVNTLPDYWPDPWIGQTRRVLVLCEKDAVLGIVRKACEATDTPFASGKGNHSITLGLEMRDQILGLRDAGLAPRVLYIGDHDPAGSEMDENWCRDLCLDARTEFQRVAITLKQADEMGLPTEVVKFSGSASMDARRRRYIDRFGPRKIELDAFPGPELEALLVAAIKRHVDPAIWKARQAEIDAERRQVEAIRRRFGT